jgi:hypothetical protein
MEPRDRVGETGDPERAIERRQVGVCPWLEDALRDAISSVGE